jgi:hypothetical protein
LLNPKIIPMNPAVHEPEIAMFQQDDLRCLEGAGCFGKPGLYDPY